MSNYASNLSVESVQEVVEEESAAPKLRRRNRIETWLFLVPALVLQLAWGTYPLIVSFILSLTDAQPILPSKFTGLQSYWRVWNDPLVAKAFQVTLWYAVISIALTFLIPIIISILLLEMPPRVMRWMMLLWFLPLSSIGSTVLWKYLYDANSGLFEYIATALLHLPRQQFLGNSGQVLFWLAFPWFLLSSPGLIYLASLQSIPQSYYEAAEVEGASFIRKIWTVTLPRLRPIISVLLTFSIINSLQEFAWPRIMTNGEPAGASRTVVMYLYQYLLDQRFADATALAVFLFLLIMALVILSRFLIKEDPDA
ncbi:carbohydrate ABC transporter permease [Tengunoibacter tsumagoiensis]|uniref:Sugar ABC transporter permease n=1 Tax=Tengunoibacter tsumagoiensis TaxID=2014871 RepID=A0A402A0X3_9CHLR|nr:sugar ABC transporter permease [Tengunoibacter tsumagoiensis]GCE12764.1 sugar ABC transporter permease [Tengunoibacter tsumagoiensis]